LVQVAIGLLNVGVVHLHILLQDAEAVVELLDRDAERADPDCSKLSRIGS